MILIYGAHVQNNNICRWFLKFFQILVFVANRGVKEQKMC